MWLKQRAEFHRDWRFGKFASLLRVLTNREERKFSVGDLDRLLDLARCTRFEWISNRRHPRDTMCRSRALSRVEIFVCIAVASTAGRRRSIIKSSLQNEPSFPPSERYYWCRWRGCMQIKTRDTEGARANTSTHGRAHKHVRHLGNCVTYRWCMYRGRARSISRAEGLVNIYALFTPSLPRNPRV